MSKILKYKLGQIEITITISEEDYDWMYALFTRNSKPFKALRDIGYEAKNSNST